MNGDNKNKNLKLPWLLLVAFFVLLPIWTWAAEDNKGDISQKSRQKAEVKIGILAKDGIDRAYEQWDATARYLTENVGDDFYFTITPLGFEEIDKAIKSHEIDFLIVNSAIYVEMEFKYHISRIATLKKKRLDGEYIQFGGVIFTRYNHPNIRSINDINSKTSVVAVSPNSLGGYLMQRGEMLVNFDIDVSKDLKHESFLYNHEQVVKSILSGDGDIGFVRTDTIERMLESGDVDLDNIRFLNDYTDNYKNRSHHMHTVEGEFPFTHCTSLYPEWPIAKLVDTPLDLSEKVGVALISMDSKEEAAIDAKIAGWTTPLNYQTVHTLLKTIKVSPYENYGKVHFKDFISQYLVWIIVVVILMILLILAFVYVNVLYLRNQKSKKKILELNDMLRLISKMMRHDILGKLTNVRTALDVSGLIKKEKLVKYAYEYDIQAIETIEDMKKLETLVSDNKDLTTFNVRETIKKVAKKQLISTRVTGNAKVKADLALNSIFENLFRNAKIHGGVDKLQITIKKERGETIIRVADKGRGLDKDIQESIFNEGVKSSKTGRNGLGLFIVRKTMERYGGSIDVESNKPKGTVFVIKFP